MTEPFEAAMREARQVLEPFASAMDAQFAVALALDRHAAAQREKDASIIESMIQGDTFSPVGTALRDAAAAIRNAP